MMQKSRWIPPNLKVHCNAQTVGCVSQQGTVCVIRDFPLFKNSHLAQSGRKYLNANIFTLSDYNNIIIVAMYRA